MELLILNPFFHPYMGGTEKHILHVGKRIARKHNVRVLTSMLEKAPPRETVEGIEVIRTPARIFYEAPHPLPPPVPIMHDFPEHLKKHLDGTEVVHVHNRFVYRPSTLRLAKDSGKKLVLTIHNSRPIGIDPITDFFGSLFDDLIAHRTMRMCDAISAVSKNTLQATVPSDYNGRKLAIHNGIDETVFRPAKKSAEWLEYFERNDITRPVVFTNARLVTQKGLGYLIEAMKGKDADLVVFGRGPLKENLERRAKQLGVNVHFITRRLSEEELVALYNTADIFALPSLYEPCAVALLEAMACGKPIVATGIGGNPELVKHKKSGLIVPVRSAEAISDAVDSFLEDEKFAKQAGREARKRVVENFTWDIVAKRFDRFYRTLS